MYMPCHVFQRRKCFAEVAQLGDSEIIATSWFCLQGFQSAGLTMHTLIRSLTGR